MFRPAKTLLADNAGLLVVGGAAVIALWNILFSARPDSMSSGVVVWWTGLCAVSVFNIGGWRLAAKELVRRKGTIEPAVYRFQRWQLLLSAVYVVGCGFRSILPRADVQRIGLYDSWVSSVLVGRSVATVAEVCFMVQWALLLHAIGKDTGGRFAVVVSWLLVPLIVVAELCSWYAVLTTCYIGNAAEETIWAISAALLMVSCLTLWSRCRAPCRRFLAAAMVLGVVYVTFMCTVDIPMYVSRWLVDEANGRQYLSLADGLQDAWCRWSVTLEWEAWRTEIPWMSLYFSVAVWCSIALVHTPWFEAKPRLES